MKEQTIYTSERNGYRIVVGEYQYKGQQKFGARITNLTTGNSMQTQGWSSYRIILEMAQEAADEALI